MYQTAKRQLRVQMLTRIGWLEGTLHLPERAFLGDYLTHAPEFLTLTDVTSPTRPEPLPYFSLSHDALRVVTVPPGEKIGAEREQGVTTSHEVHVVLDAGTISGSIEALRDTRVSDFFAHRRGFVPLANAKMKIISVGGAPPVSQDCEMVLVSADHLIGVGELRPPGS
jgi:hypothetical protein